MALAAVLLAGFGIRLINIDDSRLSFHPTRQYLGLRVARWEYLRHKHNVAPEVRRAAKVNGTMSKPLEPRILEAVVVAGYGLLGGEKLWLAGVISSFLWVLGGACLFLLARRLASDLAAWIALALHLFVPYSIVASRTFQPDPAMVAMLLAYLLALSHYHERRTEAWLLITAALAGAATLLKPMAIFVVVCTFVALALCRERGVRLPGGRQSLVCALVAVGPPAAYYGYQLATGGGVTSNAEGSFLPGLFTQRNYWVGWSRIVDFTVSWPLLIVATLAVVVARRRDARYLAAGMLVGYALFGFVFNYHIHTHDYYSLPLVPIAALGASFTIDAAWAGAKRLELFHLFRIVAAGSAVVLGGRLVAADVGDVAKERHPSTAEIARRDQAIGQAVAHSTKTVMLTADYGFSLGFEGNLAGTSWPTQADFRLMSLRGEQIPSARQAYDDLTPAPEWFIVTQLAELDLQPDLKALLAQVGDVTVKGDGYLVYRLHRAGRTG